MIKTRLGASDAAVAVPYQSASEKTRDKNCLFLAIWVNSEDKTFASNEAKWMHHNLRQYHRSTTIVKLNFCYQDTTVFRPDSSIVRKLPSKHIGLRLGVLH